jgi:hypothetical protein
MAESAGENQRAGTAFAQEEKDLEVVSTTPWRRPHFETTLNQAAAVHSVRLLWKANFSFVREYGRA